MTIFTGLLTENLYAVRFAYGLALFALGMVVAVQPRRLSRFTLARSLGALAGFAFIHAFADWGTVFIPLHPRPEDAGPLAVLWGLKTFAQAISFGLLYYFGLSLIWPKRPGTAAVELPEALPVATFGVWLAAFIVYPIALPDSNTVAWLSAAETWARYLFGLPGGLATAWGLVLQAGELRRDNLHGHVRSLFATAGFFAVYAVFAGLLVPRQPFFPAAVVNAERFLEVAGLPVEVVRGTAMLAVAYFTYRLLDIFNIETVRRVHRAEEQQAVLRERERIARDLHDGIMQTLYGVGLGLKRVVENPQLLPAVAGDLTRELSGAISDLRSHVLELKKDQVTGSDLAGAVAELTDQVGRFTGMRVVLRVEGFERDAGGPVRISARDRDHLLAIVREGLSNVIRHAGVRKVQVVLAWQDDTIVLRVTDAGQGFAPAERPANNGGGQGLENMRSRAEQLGGTFHVESAPGRGTEVQVQIPLPLAPNEHGMQTGGPT